jgi:hypothetical protein
MCVCVQYQLKLLAIVIVVVVVVAKSGCCCSLLLLLLGTILVLMVDGHNASLCGNVLFDAPNRTQLLTVVQLACSKLNGAVTEASIGDTVGNLVMIACLKDLDTSQQLILFAIEATEASRHATLSLTSSTSTTRSSAKH